MKDDDNMNVIFLDIDGVLRNEQSSRRRWEYHQKYNVFISDIDEECVKRLSKIVRATSAKVVLSSSWRGDWAKGINNLELEQSKQLQSLFDKYNIEVIGITLCIPRTYAANEKYTSWRENEIKYYLNTHPEVRNFCVIDDELFDLQTLQDFLILTDDKYGLQDEDIEKAVNILKARKLVKNMKEG